MPRITISTRDVPRCIKPGCKKKDIHRHHVRHQHLFVMAFFYVHPNHKDGGDRYDAFKRSYEEFRSEDTEYLCASHHAEVHYLYDKIIASHKVRTMKRLSDYSWEQAENLMDQFEKAFEKWKERKTPGRSAKRRWKKWYKARKGS